MAAAFLITSLSFTAASERLTAVGRLHERNKISSDPPKNLNNVVYLANMTYKQRNIFAVLLKYYLETRKSNFSLRKTDASSEVPSNEGKFETSTAKESAAAIAIAGAPRTTISLIASLGTYAEGKWKESVNIQEPC